MVLVLPAYTLLPVKVAALSSVPTPAKSPRSTSSAYAAIRFSIARMLDAGSVSLGIACILTSGVDADHAVGIRPTAQRSAARVARLWFPRCQRCGGPPTMETE